MPQYRVRILDRQPYLIAAPAVLKVESRQERIAKFVDDARAVGISAEPPSNPDDSDPMWTITCPDEIGWLKAQSIADGLRLELG